MTSNDAQLPFKLMNSVDQGHSFTYSESIDTSNVFSTSDNSTMPTVQKPFFILDTVHFVQLQIYINTALKLPGSDQEFIERYPPDQLGRYFRQDRNRPRLYRFTRRTIKNIHCHCLELSNTTLKGLMTFSGDVATFASKMASNAEEIFKYVFQIFIGVSLFPGTPEFVKAVDRLQEICLGLAAEATARSTQINKHLEALRKFSEVVDSDKNLLSQVEERCGKVLPSIASLNEELRCTMEDAHSKMLDFNKRQQEATDKANANTGFKWYYAFSFPGLIVALVDHNNKEEAENAMRETNNAYNRVASQAGAVFSDAISFRAKSGSLTKSIEQVKAAIADANKALDHMKNAFLSIQNGLGDVAKELGIFKDAKKLEQPKYQEEAFKGSVNASYTWSNVHDLALTFKENGLLKGQVKEQPMSLDIVSANFGGQDASYHAKILYNDGEHLQIRTIDSAMPDAWKGHQKSISVLCKYGQEFRIFVTREYTGTHYLKATEAPLSVHSNASYDTIYKYSKPTGARAEILAITYGMKDVRLDSTWSYCYERLQTSQPVYWNNATFGGDSWENNQKTGAIFLTTDGGRTITQCTGREGEQTSFNV